MQQNQKSRNLVHLFKFITRQSLTTHKDRTNEIHKYMMLDKFQSSIMSKLRTIKEMIPKISSGALSDPNPFRTLFDDKQPFWKSTVPNFELDNNKSINAYLAEFIQKYPEEIDGAIQAITKNPNMTPQIKILMTTIIKEYLTDTKYLFPIHINFDLVFVNTKFEKPAPTSFQSIKKKSWLEMGSEVYKTSQHFLKDPTKYTKQEIKKYANTLLKHNAVMFGAPLAGSGPYLLKIMQQFTSGNTNIVQPFGLQVQQLAKNIFTQVPTMTQSQCLQLKRSFMSQKSLSNVNLQHLCSTDSKHVMGSGSLGIVYKGTTTTSKQPVAIKMLKPVYIFYFMCELEFLLCHIFDKLSDVHSLPGLQDMSAEKREFMGLQLRQLLLRSVSDVIDEFDYKKEYLWTQLGRKAYHQRIPNVSTCAAVTYSMTPTPIMVLQAVPGRSVQDWVSDSKTTTKQLQNILTAVEDLRDLWIRTIFFESNHHIAGFFHADMHGGNVLCDFHGHKPKLYVIDFGSCGQLSKQQRKDLFQSMALMPKKKSFDKVIKVLQTVWSPTWMAVKKRHFGEQERLRFGIVGDRWRPTQILDMDTKQDPTNVLHYCHSFRTMTQQQQQRFQSIINADPTILDAHQTVVYQIKQFIKKIYEMCRVDMQFRVITDEFVLKILNYDDMRVDFGMLFLRMFKHALTMGSCVSNDVVTFGKGILYITQLQMKIKKTLLNRGVQPNVRIMNVGTMVKSNVLKSLQLLGIQVIWTLLKRMWFTV